MPSITSSPPIPPTAAPIEDGLFTWPADDPQLIGSRCESCATITFPPQQSCPRCTSNQVSEHLLARSGTLWTWTVQGFRPKSPPYEGGDDFTPYAVGYVELPGEVKVETLLADVEPGELTIGMPMELTIVPFRSTESDEPLAMFAFRPCTTEPASDSATTGGNS